MADIIRETGGPQYNVLKRLEARGYAIKRVKEGGETRYFAEQPGPPSFEAKVTSQGQVTIPKEMRERLGLHEGQKVRFTLEQGNRVVMAPATFQLKELFGILGKPRRSLTLEDMDETVREAAVERYSRAVSRRKR
jgi:AbrB family looped-hinge helix DNA binding protein